jgi:hypothetical protein
MAKDRRNNRDIRIELFTTGRSRSQNKFTVTAMPAVDMAMKPKAADQKIGSLSADIEIMSTSFVVNGFNGRTKCSNAIRSLSVFGVVLHTGFDRS